MKQTWDVFCIVVDNFGDIGVSWRLARQLASEHSMRVRLWLDDVNALAAIWPEVESQAREQRISGIDVMRWDDSVNWSSVEAADVVIEAFACRLPAPYVEAMVAKKMQSGIAPRWVNLEYLSAEEWVDGCHAMNSPQNNGLNKVFFFPGFTPKSGGLLREKNLLLKRQQQTLAQPDAWQFLTRFASDESSFKITLFGYEGMPLVEWLPLLSKSERPIQLAVTAGKATRAVQTACEALAWSNEGAGQLHIRYLPMLSQAAFDKLLWAADLNFIRGEDSFVRAIWAGKPMIWQIYPQDDGVHFEKLNAFAARYSEHCEPQAAQSWRDFQAAWNGAAGFDTCETWRNFLAQLPVLAQHAPRYAQELAQFDDLAQQLVKANTMPLA